MKLYDECKILIAGLFPLTGFTIDGFDLELSEVDISWLDINNESMSMLIGGEVYRNSFQTEEYPDKTFAVFLKSKSLTEREISEDLLLDKHKLLMHYRDIFNPIIIDLTAKLELMLGFSIYIPSYTITIYDANHNQIGKTGGSLNRWNELSVRDYTQDYIDRLVSSARININMNHLSRYRKTNLQFDRAFRLYISALKESDLEVRFVLLISSLEALFNPKKPTLVSTVNSSDVDMNELIASRTAKYTSKILCTNSSTQRKNRNRIIKYYDYRSRFIHGDADSKIDHSTAYELTVIVREALIMYWLASIQNDIFTSRKMMEFLDKYTNNTPEKRILNLQARYLRNPDYQKIYEDALKDKHIVEAGGNKQNNKQ